MSIVFNMRNKYTTFQIEDCGYLEKSINANHLNHLVAIFDNFYD